MKTLFKIIIVFFIFAIWGIGVAILVPEPKTIHIILTIWFIISVVIFFYWENPETKVSRYFGKTTTFESFITASVID